MSAPRFLRPGGGVSGIRSPGGLPPSFDVREPSPRPEFVSESAIASGDSCPGCASGDGEGIDVTPIEFDDGSVDVVQATGPYADVQFGDSIVTTAVRGIATLCRICISLRPGRRRTITICYPDPAGGNPLCSQIIVPSRGGPWCSPCIYPCNSRVTITINGNRRGPFIANRRC